MTREEEQFGRETDRGGLGRIKQKNSFFASCESFRKCGSASVVNNDIQHHNWGSDASSLPGMEWEQIFCCCRVRPSYPGERNWRLLFSKGKFNDFSNCQTRKFYNHFWVAQEGIKSVLGTHLKEKKIYFVLCQFFGHIVNGLKAPQPQTQNNDPPELKWQKVSLPLPSQRQDLTG